MIKMLNNIKEHLSSVINKLELKDDPGILNNAMDMYKNIVDFYKISNGVYHQFFQGLSQTTNLKSSRVIKIRIPLA